MTAITGCLDCREQWTGDTYEDIACTCIGSEPEFVTVPNDLLGALDLSFQMAKAARRNGRSGDDS